MIPCGRVLVSGKCRTVRYTLIHLSLSVLEIVKVQVKLVSALMGFLHMSALQMQAKIM